MGKGRGNRGLEAPATATDFSSWPDVDGRNRVVTELDSAYTAGEHARLQRELTTLFAAIQARLSALGFPVSASPEIRVESCSGTTVAGVVEVTALRRLMSHLPGRRSLHPAFLRIAPKLLHSAVEMNRGDEVYGTLAHEAVHLRYQSLDLSLWDHMVENSMMDRYPGYEEGFAESVARLMARESGMQLVESGYIYYCLVWSALADAAGVPEKELLTRVHARRRPARQILLEALFPDRRLRATERFHVLDLADRLFTVAAKAAFDRDREPERQALLAAAQAKLDLRRKALEWARRQSGLIDVVVQLLTTEAAPSGEPARELPPPALARLDQLGQEIRECRRQEAELEAEIGRAEAGIQELESKYAREIADVRAALVARWREVLPFATPAAVAIGAR